MKLTDHLLSLDRDILTKATQHDFLTKVGTLAVSPEHLKSWIIQDRYYTGGYIKMMGMMIAKLPLYEEQREIGDNNPFYSEEKAQRIAKTLSFAVSNIYRENQFFTNILNREPYAESEQSLAQKSWTSKYIDFIKKTTQECGYDLGEPLVILWAMEKVFFLAWNFAKSINQEIVKNDNSIHAQTLQELMTNWTLPEFEEFVNECESLVNELNTSDPLRLRSFERTYKDILALEVEFWDMAYN